VKLLSKDLFGKYLGKLEVDVDGDILELDVRLKDKHKIMSLMAKLSNSMDENLLEELSNVFLEILKRSYPDKDPNVLEAYLTRKFEAFITGIAIAFGWTTKEELDKRVKARLKGGIPLGGG